MPDYDIDSNGVVTTDDVLALVRIILGRDSSSKGDLNADGYKNILDLMMEVNYVANHSVQLGGTLTLASTFECISFRAAPTGFGAGSVASAQYKKTSDSTWLNAYTPIVDRRSTIATQIGNFDNTPNKDQARGSIVGLDSGTSYDVRVNWTSPDGYQQGTVSTLTLIPPTGGADHYVDVTNGHDDTGDGSLGSPWKTVAWAISHTSAGDTINLRTGTYPSMTISTSGTASAYRVIKNYPAEEVIISPSATNSVTVSANYWRIIGLKFNTAPNCCITITNGQHHVYVENCTSVDFGTSLTWADAFVCIGTAQSGANCHHIFVLNNTIGRTTDTGNNDVGDAIFLMGDGTHTIVIADNVIAAKAFKGIGNGVNSYGNAQENSDFCRNTISLINASTIELDGGSVNLRVWGNLMHGATTFDDGISEAGTIVGPSYCFRNDMISGKSNGIKQGHYGTGYCFMFHNSMRTNGSGGNEALGEAGGPTYSENHVYRNNIFYATGSAYDKQGRSNNYNYNCLYAPGRTLVTGWGGDGGPSYDTIAAFRTATGQELQGMNADPVFVNSTSDLHLQSSSPCRGAGCALANFNDANSKWPNYTDIGCYQYGV